MGTQICSSTHDVALALRVADRAGPPADLVADGALGRALDSDELRFDAGNGTFVMR